MKISSLTSCFTLPSPPIKYTVCHSFLTLSQLLLLSVHLPSLSSFSTLKAIIMYRWLASKSSCPVPFPYLSLGLLIPTIYWITLCSLHGNFKFNKTQNKRTVSSILFLTCTYMTLVLLLYLLGMPLRPPRHSPTFHFFLCIEKLTDLLTQMSTSHFPHPENLIASFLDSSDSSFLC